MIKKYNYIISEKNFSKHFFLSELLDSNCAEIPPKNGIYVVEFLEDVIVLNELSMSYNYIDGVAVKQYPVTDLLKKFQTGDKKTLYIGKADKASTLRTRVRSLIKYGVMRDKKHVGGKAIWQIQNPYNLSLRYCTCQNSSEIEKQLLKNYKKAYGEYPLANFRS